ncbi:hypothetical protein GCM10010428_45150 [Actinosynnema pretiosum subsp. pretiosum]
MLGRFVALAQWDRALSRRNAWLVASKNNDFSKAGVRAAFSDIERVNPSAAVHSPSASGAPVHQ